jgi:hypothetical protein
MFGPGAATHTVITMPWLGWVAIAFLAGMTWLTRNVRQRVWSGEHTFLGRHDPPSAWPWGAPLWRGYVRSLPVLPGATSLLVVIAVAGAFIPRHSAAASVWLVVAIAWFAAVVLGVGSIVLWARPQRLVPPAIRGRPGAVAEWRTRAGARAARRRR